MSASRSLEVAPGRYAVVDDADLSAVSGHKWSLHPSGYAYRNRPRGQRPRRQYLHRVILGEPAGYVDHINRDKLDNRRANLRVVTNSINMLNAGARVTNRSGYPGVSRARNGKWRAYITVDYKQRTLGSHRTLEAAVAARKAAERAVDPERAA